MLHGESLAVYRENLTYLMRAQVRTYSLYVMVRFTNH